MPKISKKSVLFAKKFGELIFKLGTPRHQIPICAYATVTRTSGGGEPVTSLLSTRTTQRKFPQNILAAVRSIVIDNFLSYFQYNVLCSNYFDRHSITVLGLFIFYF